MKNIRTLAILFILMMGTSTVSMAQSTRETELINYAKSQLAAGMSEEELMKEILGGRPTIQSSLSEQESNQTASRVGTAQVKKRISDGDEDEFSDLKKDSLMLKALPPKEKIFGHDMFGRKGISFEPNENMATPANYKLGPGDEVVVDVWGVSEAHVSEVISPEGRIFISQIGPIVLSGLSIQEAEDKIKRLIASKYSDIYSSSTKVSVTIGKVRTIQVSVMGEVNVAGTYRLSAFSGLFHAIYRAGGVSEIGSLRDIRLMRNGEKIASADLYEYIFEGKGDIDIRLEDGDVILVPAIANIVEAKGNFRRPMKYEVTDGEPLDKVVKYAGGFDGMAYSGMVTVMRNIGNERSIYSIPGTSFNGFEVRNGDEIIAGESLERYTNSVEVQGGVMRPGVYQFGGVIYSVKTLVNAAEGLKEDAYSGRAVLIREREDLSLETQAINLGEIMAGTKPDVKLRKNDVLVVMGTEDLLKQRFFSIEGLIMKPGMYEYADNTTVKDLIIRAGGLKDGASSARVDIVRRVMNPAAMSPSDELAEAFTYSLNESLDISDAEEFYLEPYDVVSIRKSPGFIDQQYVYVEGEVAFEGKYVLLNSEERLSSLVNRAGGFNSHAYLKGARLVRQYTEEERILKNIASEVTQNLASVDSTLTIDILENEETYSVGIQLDKAMADPGSEYDVILREGDKIIVPPFSSMVKISGDVMRPNSVSYVAGKPVSYYINQAGGYGERPKRNKKYIVYMNGMVSKASLGNAVQPGSEIVVPAKPEKRPLSVGEIVSIGSSTASLAAVVATVVNLIVNSKKN